ncbi:MAG: glycosyltransferase [Longimicrobiales bacterium]
MVKVHRVIARMNVGGPAFHVAHLSEALGPGFETTLVTGEAAEGERDMADAARQAGVDVKMLSGLSRELSPGRDASVLWELYRFFRREKPKIVHTHTAKAGAVGRVAAALAGVPVRIHTFHGHVLGGRYFSPEKTRTFIEIERQLARITSRIVALTAGQRAELAGPLGVAQEEAFRVIPLGLELERFRGVGYPADKDARRLALGLPADSVVIASVGRLVPIKRHDLLFGALARLVERGRFDWRLVVVGGGELESDLRRQAEALQLSDRITWAGWRSDVPEVLSACDLLAQPSDDEGTPVSVIEAVALGLPVVATAVGGVSELVEGVPSTWLTAAGSTEGLVAALEAAATDGAPIPERFRDRFVRRFSVERLAQDMRELYRTELERAGIEA